MAVDGKALVGIPRLPNHMRGVMISHLHVLARLRGEQLVFKQPQQLIDYLELSCDGLLTKLYAEWYDDSTPAADDAKGGEVLRAAYAPPSKGPKAAKAKKGK